MSSTVRLIGVVVALVTMATPAFAQTARQEYERALGRERTLAARKAPPPADVRAVVAAYENVVRRYPRSGYADNALWQGGQLSLNLYERTRADRDRKKGEWMLEWLVSQYPSSSLVADARRRLAADEKSRQARTAPPRQAPTRPSTAPVRPPAPAERRPTDAAPTPSTAVDTPASAAHGASPAPGGLVELHTVRRILLPDSVRISVEFDGPATWTEERLSGPARVFFDIPGSNAVAALRDATLGWDDDDIVREVRLGRHPGDVTRVVVDLEGADRYEVSALTEPHRLVVDVRRRSGARAGLVPTAVEPTRLVSPHEQGLPTTTASAAAPTRAPAPAAAGASERRADGNVPLPARRTGPTAQPAPAAPEANSRGNFSLARQLGLGVSRIVIDPGHGGRDPGALGRRITEAELVLDVALRLEKLLLAEPGFEVVLTRREDVFVPLEERTAIANRASADLFLSIHANASRNKQASGVETYFLNFALNPEAEAVAARENSASEQAMHKLPDIVKAIALNNKIDESRDFARAVQTSMVRQLAPINRDLKDLGVKQAPFVVLIGAAMPSVLAEISFVTHEREGQLLRTSAYRQKIAEALRDAVVNYQRSLKAVGTLAQQD